MSKIRSLALSGAFSLAAALTVAMAAPAHSQSRPTVLAPSRGAVTATPGRPTVVERKPIRPRGDDDSHLRERLRNACFNEPNPPAPLCRRVFGDGPNAGTRTGG